MNICIVQPNKFACSETFLRAHVDLLPGNVSVFYGVRPHLSGKRMGLLARVSREWLKMRRRLQGKSIQCEITELFVRAFRRARADVVIAEYGVTGVNVMDACRQVGVPLIVYFRGFDATHRSVLEEHRETYPQLFEQSHAIVAVSRSIQDKLISLGAEPCKIHYNPSGANCVKFQPADPAAAPPTFVAVGRLAEQKAPHVTILAFYEALRQRPEARLRIIGDGPLRTFCEELVRHLRLEEAVTLLGAQNHDVVRREMKGARAFLQHSVVDRDGVTEGTPCTVMEAGACALPVVATRHAGIADVVVENETGLLVDEWDVSGMAAHMIRLHDEPQLAHKLGQAARQRVEQHFSQQQSISRLWTIVQDCVGTKAKGGELNQRAA